MKRSHEADEENGMDKKQAEIIKKLMMPSMLIPCSQA